MKTLAWMLFLFSAAVASPVSAQSQQSSAAAAAAKPGGAASFIPANFNPPVVVEATGFKLVPLGPDVLQVDFDAYMSSIDHLQKTFTRNTNWPHKGITHADAVLDMETEQGRFRARKSFAYSVLTPDGSRERGSIYISPSAVPGYDAVVRLWVTKADYDAGFDAELYAWAIKWIGTEWPFRKVVFPGRSVDWATWDSMVAASGPKKAVPEKKAS